MKIRKQDEHKLLSTKRNLGRLQKVLVKDIIATLESAKQKGTPIVVEERRGSNTVVIELEYVGPQFAMGKSTCLIGEELTRVPYTLSYTDIITENIRIKGVEF